jgi:hypothetical protein
MCTYLHWLLLEYSLRLNSNRLLNNLLNWLLWLEQLGLGLLKWLKRLLYSCLGIEL